MWILLAIASALFAGITSVLAKIGIQDTDSNLATALRTIVVVIFAWILVLLSGAGDSILLISKKTLLFLILSGLATGASWLCYFKALKEGNINKVVPIDKSSTVLTMLLALIFLGEGISTAKILCISVIACGTLLMIERKDVSPTEKNGSTWLLYAVLSAVFASLTGILGKIGIQNIDSNLGTAIRTVVVLFMAWFIVLLQNKQCQIKNIKRKSWIFILLSGLTTGLSWICYYRALQLGPASVVTPIDKMSILISILFGYIIFKEKQRFRSLAGLFLISAATIAMVLIELAAAAP